MLYQRHGFPEEGEIVISTVTKVLPHSVFVILDEYGRKTGLIHISEVSPGRIRNIRDFVIEGRKVICKVLKVDQEKGHIDLSIRRVNEAQKRNKNNSIKMEQKAEKIIEGLAKKLKKDNKELYKMISEEALKNYDYIFECFDDIVVDEFDPKKLKLDKKIETALVETVKEKIKVPEVEIKGELSLKTYEPNGVELIKKSLKSIEDEKIDVSYLGAGKYKIMITAPDYEIAENLIKKKIVVAVEEFNKKGTAEFKR